jgi:hypothetical protein
MSAMKTLSIIAAAFVGAIFTTPAATAQSTAPVLEVNSYALYLPDQALRDRGPSVETLAGYLKAIETRTTEILTSQKERAAVSLSLVVGLKTGGKSKLWVVAANPATAARFETLLAPQIELIPAPAVRGYNAFAINVELWGGDGSLAPDTLPIPEAWKSAMPDGGLLPDTPLSVLMPD